jgi:hypothetical protein
MGTRRPRRSSRRPAPVTDETREDLLSTWRLGVLRRPPEDLAIPASEAEREQRYGIGRDEERREVFRSTLTRLRTYGVDLTEVYRALEQAQREQLLEAAKGRRIDVSRHLLDKRDRIVKALTTSVRQALRFYGRDIWSWALDKGPGRITVDLTKAEHFRAVLDVLATEPLWTTKYVAPRRRPRRGRAAQPWLKAVRKALQDASVPLADREPLLEAVGLIPYRLPR